MIAALFHALSMSIGMGWEVLWSLILAFALSAVVQAVTSQREEPTPARRSSTIDPSGAGARRCIFVLFIRRRCARAVGVSQRCKVYRRHRLELHDVAQPRIPDRWCGSAPALLHDRRPTNAQNDAQTSPWSPRSPPRALR